MNLFMILIKSFSSIVALFALTKIMGKKQISQLNMFDYVVGITIGSVAADISVDLESHFIYGFLVMVVYTFVSIVISYVTTKSIKIRRFVTGVSIVLVEDGKIIENGLKKAKFDINDFLQEARSSGYFDLSEIEYAVMEANGKISFLPKNKYKPLTPNDAKVKVNYKGLCCNVVIDGNIMEKNLSLINKDTKWLEKRLRNMGYDKIDDLLLVIIDTDEKITVYEKEIESKMKGCFE